jgi:hypothetical protein
MKQKKKHNEGNFSLLLRIRGKISVLNVLGNHGVSLFMMINVMVSVMTLATRATLATATSNDDDDDDKQHKASNRDTNRNWKIIDWDPVIRTFGRVCKARQGDSALVLVRQLFFERK